MKKLIITSAIALLSLTAMAQDRKVAVFDPAGNVDAHLKEIVREEISAIIVNAGGYTVLERQLINKVLEENRFQMGILFDDSQAAEMAKLMGANLVFVSNITPMGSNFYISCKLIEPTGRIDKQRTAQTQRGTNDLIGVVQGMAREMFGQNVSSGSSRQGSSVPLVAGLLAADGGNVYQAGRKLTPNEVRYLMASSEALQIYNNGQSQYKTGRIMQIAGALAFAAGGTLIVSSFNIDPESAEKESEQSRLYDKRDLWQATGTFIGGAGLGVGITGTVIKGKGRKKIDNAVNTYNSGSRAFKEFDFGFTGNGVGMVVRF